MIDPIRRVRRYFAEAYETERRLPSDHTETAFEWQFTAIAMLMPLLLAGLVWLGMSMPPSASDAMASVLVPGVTVLYFLSRLAWAYRIHRFARELPAAVLSVQ